MMDCATTETSIRVGIRAGRTSTGMKEKPICIAPALRKEHMTTDQLSQFCFKPEQLLLNVDENDNGNRNENQVDGDGDGAGADNIILDDHAHTHRDGHEVEVSGDQHQFQHQHVDVTTAIMATTTTTTTTTTTPTSLQIQIPLQQIPTTTTRFCTNTNEWASFRRSLLLRTESRNGRDLQRFASSSLLTSSSTSQSIQGEHQHQHQQLFRLTTGCVPIMTDGRILLVSASRKEEWILPKGGWEADESLEASALRETYEEGGVLGIPGPQLATIEYEPRKAKKRRLELLEQSKLNSLSLNHNHRNSNVNVNKNKNKTYEIQMTTNGNIDTATRANVHMNTSGEVSVSSLSTSMSEDGDAQQSIIGNNITAVPSSLSSSSLISSSVTTTPDPHAYAYASGHSHIRMSMFPLYVMEVREHWPESGRARKVVDIDTAIEVMAPRPYFQKVLMEVKEKGYHLRPHNNNHEH